MADFHGGDGEGPDRLVKKPVLASEHRFEGCRRIIDPLSADVKPISNVLGPNAARVLKHIELALDVEPKLTAGQDNLLSNDWVLWHIRQTGVPRVIALNRGFAKLEGQQFNSDRYPTQGFVEDEVLKILGVSRPKYKFSR